MMLLKCYVWCSRQTYYLTFFIAILTLTLNPNIVTSNGSSQKWPLDFRLQVRSATNTMNVSAEHVNLDELVAATETVDSKPNGNQTTSTSYVNREMNCTTSNDPLCSSPVTSSPAIVNPLWPIIWSRSPIRNEVGQHPMILNHSVILAGGRFAGADEKTIIHAQLGSRDGKEYPPCKRPARCKPLNRTFCYGTTLPYKSTSLDLIRLNGTVVTQDDVQELLDFWQNLQGFPKCWTVVQSLLCAVLVPRCENGIVDLPSHEMCRVVQGPCRIVEATVGWPKYLRCDYEENFPQFCKAEARELRFNVTSFCRPPLVVGDRASVWYEGWEGCALQCHNPFFSKEEHEEVHSFIGFAGTVCFLCSLFTVVTFFIDWKSANKYPALIIFYINWCFLISSIGWLAQFTFGARDDIVCRQDGTVRKSEPSSGENLSCVIVFVMVYYFLMAAATWFVMLTYSWYISFKVLGKIRETIEANVAYFHLISWSLPLVLTITILALGQVDGDSVTGICFVGHVNPYMRMAFVLFPVAVILVIGGFYLSRGLAVLIRLKIGSDDIISVKASSKIRNTILRLAGFAVLALLFVVVSFACHIHEFANRDDWDVALRHYLICKSNLTRASRHAANGSEPCVFESRPTVSTVQLHLAALFSAGVLMNSWIWTASTLDSWKRFLRRAFRQPINEPVKLTKHKMIAKAFAKRHQLRGSRMSFSFQSTHDDPLGMNFELDSNASQDVSSTWQAALPKFITRRGAFMGAGALGLRRNSSASEVSQRRHSIESCGTRRLSLDSQISFRMSDRERKAYMMHARQQRRRKKRRHRPLDGGGGGGGSSRVAPWTGSVQAFDHHRRRRGSSASQQSDFGSIISQDVLAAMKVNNIEKEARQLAKREAADQPSSEHRNRRFHPFGMLLGGRQRRVSGSSNKKKQGGGGQRNMGFLRGLDTPSEGDERKAASGPANVSLPGMIGADDVEAAGGGAQIMPSSGRGRAAVAHDARSTDNESVHNFGEQLSSTILVRAIRDSHSDLEMGALLMPPQQETSHLVGSSGVAQGRPTKSQGGMMESSLNNRRTGRNTVIDLETDSDNRESSSS